ncbi:hypothetical protein Q5P01_016197 [Channa striata]|uniref:Peptidase S1 domain-containing protein n=1 Tax=Channa striata TaxID=64152 RepID=A0AA88MDP0_CHASR|nr:hypothetical protein Q5P01_016197 [Channa striata]
MYALRFFLLFHLLSCLGQNALGSEIINGMLVPENSMQFMASLQANNKHVCGGFLVSEDFVMTAAHCDKSNVTRVVIGTHNLKNADNGIIREIEQRCIYPSYKEPALGHDIMLLKLSKKARPSNTVKMIKVSKINNNIKNMEKCEVAGWGWTESDYHPVDALRKVDVPIINFKDCKKQWKKVLPDNVICAGGHGTCKGFCKGDSGGPLVCKGMAVGVVSFNKDCNPNMPNVYTDISKYLRWINGILKKKKCK